MGIIADLTDYLSAAKTALDLFKGVRAELPAGAQSQQIKEQIDKAEGALKLSEVELAKALDYKLCQCTFPPQIMLWSEQEQASLCSRCGQQIPPRIRDLPPPGNSYW